MPAGTNGKLARPNPTARRFARALVRAFPKFGRTLHTLAEGHFEAHVPAPKGSSAGALECLSAGDGDIWVRFALPRAFYAVDDEKELVHVVGALLRDEARFVLSKNRSWSGNTLVGRDAQPSTERRESARIVSWSGKFDARVRPSRARPGLTP
jgi:hypothetical protein